MLLQLFLLERDERTYNVDGDDDADDVTCDDVRPVAVVKRVSRETT